jgi:hypothetical protein
VFFPQDHRPGEALQTDFTWATELLVTIQGEAFPICCATWSCPAIYPFTERCHKDSKPCGVGDALGFVVVRPAASPSKKIGAVESLVQG